MSELKRTLYALRDALVIAAAQEHKSLPAHRFDGEDADEHDVASALLIPIEEAVYRLHGLAALKSFRYKDVHGGMASHDVQVGIGTTIHQRMARFVRRRRRLPKRKEKK